MPRLPIEPVLPRLSAALAQGHAVLTAATGSGKTTRVPLALLEEPWLADQRILMLEPRRPAARMAASHMAAVLGESVGERVGYQVRFDRRIGAHTRIQVLTEGILTRRIQQDPELQGVGLIILDEFHERGLNADLSLALALDATVLRPRLRILVMSATLDSLAVSELLDGAPIIQGEGRAYPVEIRYPEHAPADPVDAASAAVLVALSENNGDVLAFLPGTAEIEQVRQRLAEQLANDLDLLPLHGNLSLEQQERALRPDGSGRRRVVLATDIAETSLTIEGIGVVVDTGLTRKPRFEPGRGLTRLVTEPISRASAQQRTGRAGRLGPGVCYRLWTQAQEQRRPAHRPAEILQADLAALALELALWGVTDPHALRWLNPPPAAAWSQGVDLLAALGALDRSGAITAVGRRMAGLPLHPRLAHMLTAAAATTSPLAADLAALLEERDPWIWRRGSPRPVDLTPRLEALESLRHKRHPRSTENIDVRRLRVIARLSDQYRRLLQKQVCDPGSTPVLADEAGAELSAGALLALAYPDRIAQNRGGNGERFLLTSGIGAALPANDALAVEPYLVVADLDVAHGDHRMRAALPISEAELRTLMSAQINSRSVLTWDQQREAVTARGEQRLGALLLSAQAIPITNADAALQLLLQAISDNLEHALHWTPDARQLQARGQLARHLQPDADWPDLSDAWLAAHTESWLGPWLTGKTRFADARALDLMAILKQTLGWQRASRLDALAPESLVTPAGTNRRIDYCADPAGNEPTPVLAAPMQEFFGAPQTPTIFEGRLPLLLHLLSPARRPLQVTSDLAGFWNGAYAEVRKEMRGRYPKHHWPEDPANALPIAGGLRRHVGRRSA
ncbi:MAG: ATP-dependent helicase HrpB [Thiohalocapsa sp. PB-PSB1]|jgi:ATP-dependent helicase HrpB|nr:MAG: ATP-dependent helicase HrpB [Thiohalocapsa sp. PB-PSB1]HCS92154.1 ATP-dependent helicase HrpB [Chromatiaceae bacterium]